MSGVHRTLDENGDVQEHCFQLGEIKGLAELDEPKPQQRAMPPAPTPAVAKHAPAKSKEQGPLTTRQLLAQLRTRLRVVEREIKSRRTLEKERDQIKRLISAAETERDNVRRLRDVG